MNEIRVTFAKEEYTSALLADKEFMISDSGYLNPTLIDNYTMQFSDRKEGHSTIDSEDVVLRLCAYAIKRLLFKNIADIGYLSSDATKMKKGIIFSFPDGEPSTPIITNTTVI